MGSEIPQATCTTDRNCYNHSTLSSFVKRLNLKCLIFTATITNNKYMYQTVLHINCQGYTMFEVNDKEMYKTKIEVDSRKMHIKLTKPKTSINGND